MKTPYSFINVDPIPQPLEHILDNNSQTNKAIAQETKLAYSAPELKAALLEIQRIAKDQSTAPNGANYNRNLLLLIEIKANNALKLLGE
jgi:hypothetical protein